MSYKERSNGFLSEMEKNTSSIENQRNRPTWTAAQTLERKVNNLEDLDIVDPPAET